MHLAMGGLQVVEMPLDYAGCVISSLMQNEPGSFMRTLIALIASAATPAIVILLIGLLRGAPSEAYYFFRGALVISNLVTLTFGLPVHLILKYKGVNKLNVYLLAGVFIGAILGILVFLPDIIINWQTAHEHSISLLTSRFPLVTAVAGFLVSLVFWLIAVRKV